MTKIPEDISRTIGDADSVVLATHVHPDGDAIGSLLGLAEILKGMNKKVFCYLEEPVPYLYRFLPGCEIVNTSIDELGVFVRENQNTIAISLDCGDSDRLGKNCQRLLEVEPFVVIDHHRSHKVFGSHRWIDADRSSTGEMVYELAQHLQAVISRRSAYNLYVAILTDTGCFCYDSTTAHTMRIAADLVETGVFPAEISGYIYNNYTPKRIRLLEKVLGTLSLYEHDALAVIQVSRQMIEDSGALPEDVEGFIDFPRSINSVKVAVFIKESRKGVVSVSLRAKGDVDVAEIAKSYGGGGHRNAAGFRFFDKSASQVHEIIIDELKRVVNNPPAPPAL